MLLPNIWEVRLHGVFEPNVANRERIVLQANQAIDMAQFFLLIGVPGSDNMARPLKDNVYWFGGIALGPGDWIVLFTGSGTPRQERDAQGRVIHTLFWGRSHTVFAGGVIPALLRAGGILLPEATSQRQVLK